YPADATAPVATVIALITETADEPIPSGLMEEAGLPKPSQRGGAQAPMGPGPTAARGPSEGQPLSVSANGDRVRSSPAARKRAQQLGGHSGPIRGSGPG